VRRRTSSWSSGPAPLQEENAELTAHVEFRMQDIKRLRTRVAELETERTPKLCGRAQASSAPCPDHDPDGAKFATARPAEVPDARRDAAVEKLRTLLAGQREDPHDGPLHHDYRLGHDLEIAPQEAPRV
jgi:hypothetical protein